MRIKGDSCVKNRKYLIKQPNSELFWSEDFHMFFGLKAMFSPTEFAINQIIDKAVKLGVISNSVFEISDNKGRVIKKYSEQVRKNTEKYLSI